MNTHTIKKFGKRLTNKYVIAGVIVLAIVLFFVFRSSTKGGDFETADAAVVDIVEKVGVTGKVTPFQKADLGFEKSGSVSTISVKVGDSVKRGAVIASLADSQTYASLVGAQAALRVAEANLADNVTDSNLDYANSQRDALNDVRDAFVSVNSAIITQADTFFEDGTSVNPTITLQTDGYVVQRDIELKRLAVTRALEQWKRDIDVMTSPSDAERLIANSRGYLTTIQIFMNTLYSVVLSFTRNNASASATTNSTYLATVNSANTSLNTAVSSVTAAANDLASTQPKSTESLRAKVDQARADVTNYEAQYSKSIIRAPFDGIVTRIDPQVGDVVAANQQVVGMMGEQLFKVEVNVPEANIAKIMIGDRANITLDAYGEDAVFGASVISIDPAETILEGVATYKVTLQFDTKDERVRSGMTANIEIIIDSKTGVVGVPSRAIIDTNGQKMVRVVNSDGKTFTETPVVTGLKGSEGMTEIVSGLEAGAKVVTFVQE